MPEDPRESGGSEEPGRANATRAPARKLVATDSARAHGPIMSASIRLRQPRPDDDIAELLVSTSPGVHESLFGSLEHATALVCGLITREGHSSSPEVTLVAEMDGLAVGVLAGFPIAEAERRERRLLSLILRAMMPWRWPRFLAGLLAIDRLAPTPVTGCWYVDSLAVAPGFRRAGVGRVLIQAAVREARRTGCTAVALDTDIENRAARDFYEATGFQAGESLRAGRLARRLTGSHGIVAYSLPVEPEQATASASATRQT